MKDTITIILILIVGIVLLVWLKRKFKFLTLPNVFLVSGRVKSGKSLLSLHFSLKQYRYQLFKYYIKKFIAMLTFKDAPEKPMLYSNIPLAKVKYNPFTFDILFRNVRIPYGSVVFLDEVSLIADSMLYNNQKINNKLMAFVKLFAHFSHNGYLIINTQSISDCHFAWRRCVGSYIWIEDRKKYPFISVLRVREMMYADDKSIVNSVNEDTELSLRNIIIWNSTYKKYDSCAYSSLTDKQSLQVDYDIDMKSYKDDLRVFRCVSLQDFMLEANKLLEKEYPEEYKVYGYIGVYNEKEKKVN